MMEGSYYISPKSSNTWRKSTKSPSSAPNTNSKFFKTLLVHRALTLPPRCRPLTQWFITEVLTTIVE